MYTPARVAAVGTVVISALSFILSFASLEDLAARSGVAIPLLWPLIVDGQILVSTFAVVAVRGSIYAWTMLGSGAAISIAGNILDAIMPTGPLPPEVAACVAVVPPVALVAVTHLTVHLARHATWTRQMRHAAPAAPMPDLEYESTEPVPADWVSTHGDAYDAQCDTSAYVDDAGEFDSDAWTYGCDAPVEEDASPAAPPLEENPTEEPEREGDALAVADDASDTQRDIAEQLMRDTDLSNYAVAERVGKSEATIRRWRKAIDHLDVSTMAGNLVS